VSYAFACSSCHAMDGLGGALGPRLLLRPDLADPQAFVRLIAEGRRGMPPLPGVRADEALDILAHLRALGLAAGAG
jgi:mono/diheme cytochrome c family protein